MVDVSPAVAYELPIITSFLSSLFFYDFFSISKFFFIHFEPSWPVAILPPSRAAYNIFEFLNSFSFR